MQLPKRVLSSIYQLSLRNVPSGNYTEAIRELEPLVNKSEVALAATATLLNAHKMSSVKGQKTSASRDCSYSLLPDKEAIEQLKVQLKNLSKTVRLKIPLRFYSRFALEPRKCSHFRRALFLAHGQSQAGQAMRRKGSHR